MEYNETIREVANDNKNFLPTAAPPKICHFASNPSPGRGPIFDRISHAWQKRPVEGFGTNVNQLIEIAGNPENRTGDDHPAYVASAIPPFLHILVVAIPTPSKSQDQEGTNSNYPSV